MLVTLALGRATPQQTVALQLPARQVTHLQKVQPTVKEAVAITPQPQQVETPPPAVLPPPAPVPAPAPPVLAGKDAWLAASVIASSNYGYVDYIVSHESSWNPDATEPNTGAHGLIQILPYSKSGCGWDDAVCQLNWANNYAGTRYGSWYQAYLFWTANHWW